MSPHRIVAVITTFQPDDTLVDAVTAAKRQVYHVVVVDDASAEAAREILGSVKDEKVTIISQPENLGIAAALNRGIIEAQARGADFILTLDQDSELPANAAERLLAGFISATDLGHAVGFVAPERFARVSQVFRRGPDGVLLTRNAIQSGMLIPASTMRLIQGFREDLFIDLVDTEFELRCASLGLRGIAAPGLAIGHSLGNRYSRGMLFGRWRLPLLPAELTLSKPFRYYYRSRNRVLINRLYLRRKPWWLLRDWIVEMAHFVDVVRVARPRSAMIRVIARGKADALRGRFGRIPEEAAALSRLVSWRVDRQDGDESSRG